jgi:hypothetical protein
VRESSQAEYTDKPLIEKLERQYVADYGRKNLGSHGAVEVWRHFTYDAR